MADSMMYHAGNRKLQDAFESRRIADRLEEKLTRAVFTADDAAFIESVPYFFLASADADGRPDCSFKGGLPGFVRVVGPSELAFPDYDGNGMFKSLGNVAVNAHVGMLFIATVLAYAVIPWMEEKAKDAGEMPPESPLRDALRQDGWKWVLVEVALLVVLGLLSMGLDRYRRWRMERPNLPENPDATNVESPPPS